MLGGPGLEWAFGQLGIAPKALPLTSIERVHHVLHEDGRTTAFGRSPATMVAGFEAQLPGSGALHKAFVEKLCTTH